MPSHVRLYGNREATVEVTHIGLSAGAQAREKLPKVVEHARELGHIAIIPREDAVPADSFSPVDVFIIPPMEDRTKQAFATALRTKEGVEMIEIDSLQQNEQARAA